MWDHVDTWVFDLDNTLYHPSVRLFDQIEEKMRSYICRHLAIDLPEADALRARYWRDYGTTLAGLMANHNVDPMHFLTEVHALDFTVLTPDPSLASAIDALPGRKIVYTNGDALYAANVLRARGLLGAFNAIYGIEHAGFLPKPHQGAFDAVFARDGLDPGRAAMFEDDVRNLEVPAQLGMATILVHTEALPAAHIQHRTSDLTRFLSQITR